MIKIWVDDERPMPEGYDARARSVCEAILAIALFPGKYDEELFLDLDHDAGEFRRFGGDFITILEFLEYMDKTVGAEGKIKVHFHSANPVGVKNMRAIVENCPWMEEA